MAFSCFLSAKISFASGSNCECGMGLRSWKRSTPGGWVSITFIRDKDTSIKTGGQREALVEVWILWSICAVSVPFSDFRFQRAQLPLRFRITGPEPQGFLILEDRLFGQVLGEQHIAKVEMHIGHAG